MEHLCDDDFGDHDGSSRSRNDASVIRRGYLPPDLTSGAQPIT